jgi:hypothetical protein
VDRVRVVVERLDHLLDRVRGVLVVFAEDREVNAFESAPISLITALYFSVE